MSTGIVLVIFYLCLFPCYQCYLNVVLMHGILASSSDMDKLAARITEAHPGTQVRLYSQISYIPSSLFTTATRSCVKF